MNSIEERIIDAYRDGIEMGQIVESVNLSYKAVRDVLIQLKESNRHKRTFTDEFKKIIAERDVNGVSRRQISQELEINANTVKRACELFGQALKDIAPSGNEYTKLDGKFDIDSCPTCKSKDVNLVDEKTTYCMKCGNEHIFDGYSVLKVNWEHLE